MKESMQGVRKLQPIESEKNSEKQDCRCQRQARH
jgi:hypothetical protein